MTIAEKAVKAYGTGAAVGERDIKPGNIDVPRTLDMVDGLLHVVEVIGNAEEKRRAAAARKALAGRKAGHG